MKKKSKGTDPENLLITQSLLVTDMWVEAERKRLLSSILPWVGGAFISGAVIALIAVVDYVTAWQLWVMLITLLISVGFYFYARSQAKQGYSRISSVIILASLSINALIMAALFENLLVAYAILGLLIGLAGIVLLSRRAGYIASIIYTVAGFIVLILQQLDILDVMLEINQDRVNLIDMCVYIITVLFGMYLVSLSRQGTQNALDQLVEQSNELKLMNRQLEREIRQRKRAENALAELNASLEATVKARTEEILAEKERSDTILRSVGDAISVTGLNMDIQYVNDAFTRITGYTQAEAIGQPMYILLAASMPDRERQLQREQLTQEDSLQGEIIARRKDGRTYDAELTIAPVHNPEGQRIGYVFSHQDITSLKELDRARSRFITNVSHELRTPVTILKLAVHLLKSETSPERSKQQFEIIEKQSVLLENLIQDILEMTVFDSGKGIETWASIPLVMLVQEAVIPFTKQIEAKGLKLFVPPLPENLPSVMGDQLRLNQALKELLENAITFTPTEGKIHILVETLNTESQPWVTIAVKDTGPGISKEEQVHIFERFYRGKLAESGHIPGTGLGLSLVDEIMRAHSGKVTVESELGQGSTFKLWLLVNSNQNTELSL
jgi:PAS domain S-box-containing protein